MPGRRLSVKSGRGVAAPGGVELLEPIWSWTSSSLALLGGRRELAKGMMKASCEQLRKRMSRMSRMWSEGVEGVEV
jgi:hypothetical protein